MTHAKELNWRTIGLKVFLAGLLLCFLALPVRATASGNLDFQGQSTYQISGSSVYITIDKIVNSSSSYTSGSLRLDLWAFTAPYAPGALGYKTASIRTSQLTGLADQIGPSQTWSNITLNLTYTPPAAGYTSYTLILEEYNSVSCSTSDHFCVAAYLNYTANLPPAPAAAFNWTPTSPTVNEPVQFRDISSGTPTSWSWTFGDGGTSTAENPTHTYSTAGTYSVLLTATNAGGSNSSTNSITVAAGGSSGNSSSSAFTVPNLGATTMTSSGLPGTTSVGYAAIQPNAGSSTPSGVAIFGFRQNGVLVSEAGVPATPAIQNGRIYAEVSTTVNTGLAIANPNTQAATVSFYFTDSRGNFGNGSTTIPANGQIASFLNQAPFNAPASLSGTFTFSSSVPIAVTALRGLTNERSEFLITTLPVADLSAGTSTSSLVFPHFADGGGWATQIVLVNPTDNTLTGNVQFLNPAGQSATLNIGGQTNNSFSYSIPARSSQTLQTSGGANTTTTGSARIVASGGTVVPSGLAIFSFKNAGITVSEAGVPGVVPGTAFRLYAEAVGDPNHSAPGLIETGLAVANSSATAATVTLQLYQLDGTLAGTGTLSIPGNGQTATFINQIPGLASIAAPFQGVLRVSSSASISVVGLRGRYNERTDFLITTIPAINEAAPVSSSPLYFPHLADGGGYSTEFILFSGHAGQSSAGSLQFSSQAGAALNLTVSSASANVTITSLGTNQVDPFTILTVNGTGFDPSSAAISVLLIPASGGPATAVPAVAASTTTVQISVPPLLNPSGFYTSGVVSVQVVQMDGATLSSSNIVNGLTINAPQTVSPGLPAGAVTLAFLKSGMAVSSSVISAATTNSTLTSLAAALGVSNNNLNALIPAITAIMNDPSQSVTLPTTGGSGRILNASVLALSDQLIWTYVYQFNNIVLSTSSDAVAGDTVAAGDLNCTNLGGQFEQGIMCSQEVFQQTVANKSAKGLQLAVKIETGAYLGVLGGWAIAGSGEAELIGENAATAAELAWDFASSHIAAYAANSDSPSWPESIKDAAAKLIDKLLEGKGVLPSTLGAYGIFEEASKLLDSSTSSVPGGGLIVTGSQATVPANSSSLLILQNQNGQTTATSVAVPRSQQTTAEGAATISPPPASVATFQISAVIAGLGSGTISANPPGFSYAPKTVVTLTATPDSQSTFTAWGGDCSGSTCTLTMDGDKLVVANFNTKAAQQYNLTIAVSGTGGGTVTPSPAGSSCGSNCWTYAAGTSVTVTATPNSNSTFGGWSGACSGTGACTITINGTTNVTATFNPTSTPTGTGLTGKWTGTWTHQAFGLCSFETNNLTWTLQQTGSSVSGTFVSVVTAIDTEGLCPDAVGDTFRGSLVQGTVNGSNFFIYQDGGTGFGGTISGNTISGTGGSWNGPQTVCSNGTCGPFTVTKQQGQVIAGPDADRAKLRPSQAEALPAQTAVKMDGTVFP